MSGKNPERTEELTPLGPVAGGSPAIRAEQIPAGHRVGDYLIQSRIDAGGGGTVYVAQAASDPDRRVAIKILLHELAASPLALGRFQREAEVVRLIDHPNIAKVLESGELADGRPYIVMELVSTENLKAMLEKRGRFTPAELPAILEPVCSALAAAHAAGVVHRDLKASNISVGASGDQLVIKLLDFGIAKMVQPDGSTAGLTVLGTRLGTPHAMAPEQVRGEPVDERADIYALGVLIYQLLTGSYPFTGATPQELERLHLVAAPPRPSRAAPVPAALDELVLRCLAKQASARYQSVTELLAALRVAVGGPGPQGQPAERDAIGMKVQLPAGSEDDEESADLLDEAERTLREAGYQLPVQTGNLLVAVQLVSGDERQARRQALALGRDLVNRGLAVTLHAAPVTVQGSGAPASGPLLRLDDWTPVSDRDGLLVTPAADTD